MIATTARKPVIRHRCIHGITSLCARGAGKGPAKCRTCGGRIVRQAGLYGVFVWRSDGRYPAADAISMHRTEASADKATGADSRYVVRWISMDA